MMIIYPTSEDGKILMKKYRTSVDDVFNGFENSVCQRSYKQFLTQVFLDIILPKLPNASCAVNCDPN